MAEFKEEKLIRDALGSPIPQYFNVDLQTFAATTADGSVATVDFSKTKLLRDKLGSPIPQLWDVTSGKWIEDTGQGGGNGEAVTMDKVIGLPAELSSVKTQLAQTAIYSQLISGKQILNGHGTKVGFNNTISSYESIAKNGSFTTLEIDTWCTSDGIWVCNHDNDVSLRTTGVGNITEMTHSQVKTLTVTKGGNNLTKFPNLKIPTLEEAVSIALKNWLIPLIEYKNHNPTTGELESFVALLKKLGIENNCIIATFHANVITKLRELTNATLIWLIPANRGIIQSDFTFALIVGRCGLGIEYSKIIKSDIEQCKAKNIFTMGWTAEFSFQIDKMRGLGINLIGTDSSY